MRETRAWVPDAAGGAAGEVFDGLMSEKDAKRSARNEVC
jgi:hypothetical protein